MLYYVKERKIAMKNRNGRAIIISCVDWYDQRMKYIEQYLNGCDFETAIVLSDFNHYSKKTDKRWSGNIGSPGDCIVPNSLADNVSWLHEFLFDESGYVPSNEVQTFSDHITSVTSKHKPKSVQ